MKSSIKLFAVLACLPSLSFAIDPVNTRMLSQPAVSSTQIAFIYADDLWTANLDGSNPKRLTIDEGFESAPAFSPDGKTIAFSAQYDGNTDVYTIPSGGGIPKRLTWHPGSDQVRGFSSDGKSVLFASQREMFNNRYAQLFRVNLDGSYPEKLNVPNVNLASMSADGTKLAYTPISDMFRQWKHYRGGASTEIWIYDLKTNQRRQIPKPETGSNDTGPIWMGNKIYFRSDRNGEFNLHSYDISTGNIEQLTRFTDFPVLNASGSSGKIVFEQAGYLHVLDAGSTTPRQLQVGIAADLQELRPRYASGNHIRGGDISPSGNRAVFDFRGEIITLPAEKGDPRNITNTPGVHETYPAWSPDGRHIAYFSDASGEYALHVRDQEGKSPARSITLNGTGFYAYLRWSPDSKKLSYVDNGRNVYVMDVTAGTSRKIDTDELYVPGAYRDMVSDWSSDSKWLAYTKVTGTQFKRIYLYSVDEGKSHPVTDGLSDAAEPKFDRLGKYLFFLASTNAGPVLNWFDQSNADMRSNSSIYLLTLQKETVSPLARLSDEETPKADEASKPAADSSKETDSKKSDGTKNKDDKNADKSAAPQKAMNIDWQGIETRIVDLPLPAANIGSLAVGADGELLYIVYPDDFSGPGTLHSYDLKKQKDTELFPMNGFVLSQDGKKMLSLNGSQWNISNAGQKPAAGPLNTGAIQVKVDPSAEWTQIFNEAWRVNRDYFYDPGMHGNDWSAVKKKYEAFLPHLSSRSDLNSVLQWMGSELGVGHHYLADGERWRKADNIPGGLLGADYSIENNRYRLKKIYGGLNWNPNLRSPLTEPGVNAQKGEYLLAVNGQEITAEDNLFKYFENTANKITNLTIGPNPSMTDSRVVKVVPVANESALRNRDWVEGNLKRVHEATNGQVAYVYVPNTAGLGHEYFKRYFYPQANKKAIIIDERFNGGGQLADYYIDLLQRPYQAHWNTRYGKDLKTPSASIQGPKVMIIDETAGSGGDMLPWMFRKFNVGTIVGKRTWGGLVGILGYPEFIDGGNITAPNIAIWTNDGFIVENEGVAPDIEVEQTPSEVLKGKDPQLEKAIEVALQQLKENPPVEPVRPAYPVKVRRN